MTQIRAVSVVLIIMCLTAGHIFAMEIQLDRKFSVKGGTTLVTVVDDDGNPLEGAEVKVIYQPESKVERSAVIGTTDRQGQLTWNPEYPGVVSLTASLADRSTTHNVSVCFARPPVLGICIFLGAGFILFGGVIWAYIKLMQDVEVEDEDTASPA